MSANAAANAPASEHMVFPAKLSPIGVFFVVVPAAVLGVALWVLVTWRLPYALMLLLALAIGTCGVLVREAVSGMAEVKVEWTGQGVTINSLLDTRSFVWTEVEKVELSNPGASFGDFGRHEEARAAVGLFIRDPAKKERAIDAPPDVLVVCRSGDGVDKIPKLAERLSTAKRTSGGPTAPREIRKIGQPATPARAAAKPSGKGFRRTAAG